MPRRHRSLQPTAVDSVSTRVFHDPDEYIEALDSWGAEMRMIATTGPFRCALEMADCGAISCLTAKMTPYTFELRARATTFVFLDEGSPSIWRNGVEITDRDMLAWPSRTDYVSRHEYPCVANAVTVPDAELGHLFDEPFSGVSRIRPPARLLRRLRHVNRAVLGGTASGHAVIYGLVECLAAAEEVKFDRTRAMLRALHTLGLSDKQIARRLCLEEIVVRAQRRQLGLPPNEPDPPFGVYERDWLALQLALGAKADRLLEQFREVLLNVPRQPLGGQEDPD